MFKRIRKILWILSPWIIVAAVVWAGTWKQTDSTNRFYKLGYGEYGATVYDNYSNSIDNLFDRVWTYNYKLVTEYSNFATALSTIGSVTKTSLLIPANLTLTQNTTVTSNIHLKFLEGAVITLGNYNLTINGPMDRDPISQRFNESGTGKVTLGRGYGEYAHPEWWGNNTTPATTDMTAEIQSANDAVKGIYGKVKFISLYKITSTLKISTGVTWEGNSIHQSGSAIVPSSMSGSYAIQSENFGVSSDHHIIIRDLSVYGTYGSLAGAIRLQAYWVTLENIKTEGTNNTNGAVRLYSSQDVSLDHVILLGHSSPGTAGTGYGLKIESSNDIHGDVDTEGFTVGVYLSGSKNSHLVTRHEIDTTGLYLNNSNLNWIKASFHNCATRWLNLTGTSDYNHFWIFRGSDTNVPASPVLIDTNTTGNYIHTKEAYTLNTTDVFIFDGDEIKNKKVIGPNFIPFTDSDATPSVSLGNNFKTGASAYTITMFDDGKQGQEIIVLSQGAVTYDVTGTNLKGGTTDIITAAGDLTKLIFDGTNWSVIARMDMSDDLN